MCTKRISEKYSKSKDLILRNIISIHMYLTQRKDFLSKLKQYRKNVLNSKMWVSAATTINKSHATCRKKYFLWTEEI